MRVGMLGTGTVGRTLGTRLVEVGREVCMGSRTADNPDAVAWADEAGAGARHGTFADAVAFGEVVFNATAGTASLAALGAAHRGDLDGKLLVDVANPLDFSQGFPPRLDVSNDDSLAEQIQREFPNTLVVKTLNTVNASVMVDPGRVDGLHHVFLSGDDEGAKRRVAEILASFGWPVEAVVDLGDITTARGPEMYLALWVRLYGALDTADFNLRIVR